MVIVSPSRNVNIFITILTNNDHFIIFQQCLIYFNSECIININEQKVIIIREKKVWINCEKNLI